MIRQIFSCQRETLLSYTANESINWYKLSGRQFKMYSKSLKARDFEISILKCTERIKLDKYTKIYVKRKDDHGNFVFLKIWKYPSKCFVK